jgi:hypothetical protein
VSAWQNVHAIRRIGKSGGAWLKDGFVAPN